MTEYNEDARVPHVSRADFPADQVGVYDHIMETRKLEFMAELFARMASSPGALEAVARRDAVDGEDDRALGGDDLADLVREGEDAHELVARAGLRDLGVVAVRAHVDDAVHVEVQVVDVRLFLLRGQAVGHALHDRRVLVREPTKHLRDAARDDGGAGRLSHMHRLEPADGPGRERQQQ